MFYDPDARIFSATPAPVDEVEFTPLRFALVQSALRDMYELVATRPGGEAREPVLEAMLARWNKLVLNGWDDRDRDQRVGRPTSARPRVDGIAARRPADGRAHAHRRVGRGGTTRAAMPGFPTSTATPTASPRSTTRTCRPRSPTRSRSTSRGRHEARAAARRGVRHAADDVRPPASTRPS